MTAAETAVVDAAFMASALSLARRGLGRVWPNPAVGCVLVDDGVIVGRGWTQPGGRPHAETEAMKQAGQRARGATAYVTLEPCAHHGKTPPCAEALIAAGIGRCVVALTDPDPRVMGRGIMAMEAAGIPVITGVGRDEALNINHGFFLKINEGRPLFTLKLASSLDGRIATTTGESRWITGEAARRWVHRLRTEHDAILVGSETVLADDPDLTCRLPGMEERSPLRLVADRRLRLPLSSRLVKTASQNPTWVLTAMPVDEDKRAVLSDAGVHVIPVPADGAGQVTVRGVASMLGSLGLTRVLVEAGGQLAAAFLNEGLADRLIWFHGPKLIGGDGIAAIGPLGRTLLADAPHFEARSVIRFGDDVAQVLVPQENNKKCSLES